MLCPARPRGGDGERHCALRPDHFVASAVGLVAVLANRLTERVKIPVPLLVLVGGAVAVNALPALHSPPERTVERVITIALVLVLFS